MPKNETSQQKSIINRLTKRVVIVESNHHDRVKVALRSVRRDTEERGILQILDYSSILFLVSHGYIYTTYIYICIILYAGEKLK